MSDFYVSEKTSDDGYIKSTYKKVEDIGVIHPLLLGGCFRRTIFYNYFSLSSIDTIDCYKKKYGRGSTYIEYHSKINVDVLIAIIKERDTKG